MILEKKLLNKILINLLTFFRIPLTFIFIYYSNKNILILFIIFLIIILTDYLDGKLSRKYNITSYFGSIFDIFCDFFFIITSLLYLSFTYNLVIYIIILIIINFLIFIITSIINRKIFFDKIGRLSACLFYLLTFLIIVFNDISLIIIFIILVINILTLINRIKYIKKQLN